MIHCSDFFFCKCTFIQLLYLAYMHVIAVLLFWAKMSPLPALPWLTVVNLLHPFLSPSCCVSADGAQSQQCTSHSLLLHILHWEEYKYLY